MKARITYRLPNELEVHSYQGMLRDGLIKGAFVFSEFSGEKCWSIVQETESNSELKLPKRQKFFEANRSEYEASLKNIIERIKNTDELEKVVFSRNIQEARGSKTVVQLFEQLSSNRPSAFVYLLESEQHGIWLGASPEVLIHGEGKSFKTYSLAGTRPSTDSNWTAKEIREQELVTEYMSHILKDYDPSLNVGKVTERLAGNVKHLLTELDFQLESDQLENLIHELHPTPAVCGLDKTLALEIIQEMEGYERNLYAGFIGPYQVGGSTSLFVNLRCAQLDDERITLFVGGGVTAESIPSSEWEETELKSQSIRSLLD